MLHLHRLERDQLLALGHRVALLDLDRDQLARHRRDDRAVAGGARCRAGARGAAAKAKACPVGRTDQRRRRRRLGAIPLDVGAPIDARPRPAAPSHDPSATAVGRAHSAGSPSAPAPRIGLARRHVPPRSALAAAASASEIAARSAPAVGTSRSMSRGDEAGVDVAGDEIRSREQRAQESRRWS